MMSTKRIECEKNILCLKELHEKCIECEEYCTRSVTHTQCHAHTVSRTHSVTQCHALTRHMAHSLVVWTIRELKHVLTRLITAGGLENTALYVVVSNILH